MSWLRAARFWLAGVSTPACGDGALQVDVVDYEGLGIASPVRWMS